jgi:hypothetical protein
MSAAITLNHRTLAAATQTESGCLLDLCCNEGVSETLVGPTHSDFLLRHSRPNHHACADAAGVAALKGAAASENSARYRATLGRFCIRDSQFARLLNSGDGAPSINDAMLIGEKHEMSATLNSPHRYSFLPNSRSSR